MDKTYWLIKFPWTEDYNEYLSPEALESIYNIIDQADSLSATRGECVLAAINAAPCTKQLKAFRFTDRHDAYLVANEINECIKYVSQVSTSFESVLKNLRLKCNVIRVYPKIKKVEKK